MSRTATDGHEPAIGHARTPIRPVGWHEIAGLTPLMVLIVCDRRLSPVRSSTGSSPSVAPIAARFPSLIEAGPKPALAAEAEPSRPVTKPVPHSLSYTPTRRQPLMPTDAFESPGRRLLILLPELLILLVGDRHDDGRGVRPPSRDGLWCAIAAGAMLVAALLILIALAAPDDRPLLGGRAERRLLVLRAARASCWPGLILLALAHDQVDDARAPEFFGALLMINAGSMLVAAANELVFLFVGLELVSIPTYLLLYLSRRNANDAGGGDQVLLPEHLLVGPAALRPGVPLRPDRASAT